MQTRVAVRVVLLDADSRVLLFEGQDLSDPNDVDRWWFTVGGGVEPGEGLPEAAQRELHEETGLTGIVLVDLDHQRESEFLNHGQWLRQVEYFFAARTRDTSMSRAGWTELEHRAVVASRWWSCTELIVSGVKFFPENLVALVGRADDVT